MSKQEMQSRLTREISFLRRFNSVDHKMQVGTILTFLEIALADLEDRDVSVQDLEQRIGLLSGTASRNTYYWAQGHKDNTGAHNFVEVSINDADRRRRDLKLTQKGNAFLHTLVGE